MVLRAVCVLLALATLVQGDGHDELCSRVAFQPLAKTLTCGTGCTSDNVSIVWTLKVDDRFHPALATFRYGQPHNISIGVFQYKNVRVSMDGKLEIGLVSTEAHKGQYNCTAYDVSGRQCGITDSFDLNVASLFQDLSVQPVIVSDVVRKTAYYGSRNVLCFNGQSPGIALSETYWKKDGVLNENVVNVSSECLGCVSCEEEDITRYLSLPSVKKRTMSYKYSAFVISVPFYKDTNSHIDYSECVTISNNYVTFLVINNVRAEDDGWFQVSIRSQKNPQPATGKTGIRAEYKKIQSVVDDSLEDMTISSGEKGYVVCSATTTADLNDALHWEFLNSPKSVLAIDSVAVADISEPIPSNISISDEVLDDLCSKYAGMLGAEYVAFSINYANETLLLPRANDHALVQRHFLVLVVCDAGSEQTGTYSCVAPMNDASDREERNMDLVVEGRRKSSGFSINPGGIAGVVLSALVIIAIMILLLMWGIRRYRLLKYEAMQMRPMSIPLAATQLTNAINHAFSSFSPIGSPMYDKFEFPRENLMLLEVIGEGQFGQVWRARAIGICSEDSRNIVAVKTLKDNYRDADYFDLRSELDIMRRMEPHPNIINLLGVCSEIASKPMCILMEYAAYGSMKDYLAYCRRVMQAHAEGLASPTLEEAYPSAAASNGAIICQSMLMGDYPQLQPLGMQSEGNDYHYDPMVASRTRRLIQMLKLEGFKPGLSDEASYNHLAGAEASGVSLYDQLYPQSQCVYRPCLETYNYACYRGAKLANSGNAEQEYYNAELPTQGDTTVTSGGDSVFSSPEPPPPALSPCVQDTTQLIEASPPPIQITAGTTVPPSASTPVRKKAKVGAVLSTPQPFTQENLKNCTSMTASQDNVFEELGSSNLLAPSKENMRESMISFPDGYIYAPASTIHGDCSPSHSVDGDGEKRGAMERKEKQPAPPMEDMITHLDLLDFALQIARGMDHLERMQCVHRDLAARNVLISEDFTLKIGDFGLARDLSDKDYYRKVTPGRLPARWMAPESLEERTHTFQSDVWSYAVVLWEIMMYGEVPYRGQPEANDCDHLAYFLRSGNRLAPPPNISDEFRDLMSSCWALNPDKRPSFNEIIGILDNQLSAAHGYLTMATADRISVHDPGSTNPSPRMQKRKAMLQKLDKLHGADRPVSLQPGAFCKSKLAKSPSLPIAEPLGSSAAPPTAVFPYILPTPTLRVPGTTLSVPRPGSPYKFGSNPELSLSTTEIEGASKHGGGKEHNGGVMVNGVGSPDHNVGVNIETQL